jgi:hypothetical protein
MRIRALAGASSHTDFSKDNQGRGQILISD